MSTVDQIIQWCDGHGEDAIAMLQDYFDEKDSHFSRYACQCIVDRRRATWKEEHEAQPI